MKLTQREESGLCRFVSVREGLIPSRVLDVKYTNDIFLLNFKFAVNTMCT